MTTKESNVEAQLPENLRAQFKRLERRLWWVDTIVAISAVASGFMVSYALVFVSDRFWDTPAWLRAGVSLAGLAWAAAFIWGWLRQWTFQRRDFRGLSLIVQRHYRRLGDRLLGIVELADERSRPINVSPALCRAAIHQVSAEAVRMEFREAVALRKPRICLVGGMCLVALVLTPWILVPEAGWNTLARWFWPGSGTSRFTFVNIESLPDRLVVAHGEPFEISYGVQLHPFWKPSNASAQFESQEPLRAPIVAGRVAFAIPAQTAPGRLRLRIGDISRTIAIEPLPRPALQTMRARIKHPAYLQHPDANVTIPKGMVGFVEGSQLAFTGVTSRALAEASLVLKSKSATNQSTTAQTESVSRLIPIQPVADGFATDWLESTGPAQATFNWRDIHGLAAAAPWVLGLQSHTDALPEVSCPEQAAVVAILPEEILEIRTESRDDFGLRQNAMIWECRKPQATNILAQGTEIFAQGAPEARELKGVYRFAPEQLGLPADVYVSLRAATWDYFPDRPATHSDWYRIYVLSHEEHARLLQQELEKVMAELEELTRRQESLKEAGRNMRGSSAEEMASSKSDRKLSEQMNEQQALAAKLAQLSQQVASTLKEALRNKTIPTDLLQQWAQNAEAMQSLAQNQMPKVVLALSSAMKKPSDRAEPLDQAIELEEEVLKALLELQKRIAPALDQMLVNTLANRFRRVAKTQADIGRNLRALLPETIGLSPDQLPENHRQTLTTLASEDEQASQESRDLENEINRFFDRTTQQEYGTVGREMRDKKASEELRTLSGLVRENVAAQAEKKSAVWKDQFEAWAALLERTSAGDSSKGGQSGGSMAEAAMKRLLALLRLRQFQQNVREHTQLLETRRPQYRGYREDAIVLSIRQLYLKDDTKLVEKFGPSKYLGSAQEAMGEAETLLNLPKTDEPVVAAETDAVNLLEAEIMDMLQSVQGTPLAATMGMMMQTMGMGASAGGSLAGGSTSEPNPELTGDFNGASGEEKNVEKTSGRSTRTVPVEFREALQQYHRALEKLESSKPESQP